jgi:hypothetical protein
LDAGYSAAAGSLASAGAVLAGTAAGALERTLSGLNQKNEDRSITHGGIVGLVGAALAAALTFGASTSGLGSAGANRKAVSNDTIAIDCWEAYEQSFAQVQAIVNE